VAGAALALGGCISEDSVQVKTVETHSMGVVTGRELEYPLPTAAALVQELDGGLEVDVRWVALCSRLERGVAQDVRIVKTKVSTATIVYASLFTGLGMAFYWAPGLDANASLAAGSAMVAVGGIPYGLSAAQTGEKQEKLPERAVERQLPPGPCFAGRGSNEKVVIRGGGQSLTGQTDSLGHVRFDTSVPQPVEVFVRGKRVEKVEWKK